MPAVQRARESWARSSGVAIRASLGFLLMILTLQPAVVDPARRDVWQMVDAPVGKTGKERLSDKASDEQRANDCKVPQGRRTRARPADCP